MYLVITHDQRQPYGCRAIGFRSSDIPSRIVLLNSGMPCLSFVPKTERQSGARSEEEACE